MEERPRNGGHDSALFRPFSRDGTATWMSPMRLFKSFLLISLLTAAPALAQQAPPAVVGRLAYVSGTVAFHMAGETAWSAAARNYPVASGVSLWTDRGARAEIRVGPNMIAMDSDTELDIGRLNPQITHLTLPAGRIDLHIRQLGAGQSFEIDIPRGGVYLLGPGLYDIAAGSETEPARVTVFRGHAHFLGGGADLNIDPGVVAILSGFNPVTAVFAQAEPDDFVAWCRARDFVEARLVSPRYVSTEMTGYAVLDQYGHWAEIPGYGAVWFPNAVAAGWRPYRDGYWVWIAPWGWTWIDDEPWGFAPTHYGRWTVIGASWGWVPGRPVPHPVYAPALVAFIRGFFERNRPLIAWFPLAPGEVYWPAYTRDLAYIRAVNAPVVRDVDKIALGPNGRPPRQVFETRYVNQRFAVLVPERAFAGARNARLSVLSIAPTRLERVPATFAPPHIRPVIAHPLPPPRRIAAAPPGRQGSHPPPFIKPPPHPAMAETAPAAAGPAVLRGLPRHPATAALRPPAAAPPGLVRPAHPLPPNAAMLPPLPPRQPPLSAGRHAGAAPARGRSDACLVGAAAFIPSPTHRPSARRRMARATSRAAPSGHRRRGDPMRRANALFLAAASRAPSRPAPQRSRRRLCHAVPDWESGRAPRTRRRCGGSRRGAVRSGRPYGPTPSNAWISSFPLRTRTSPSRCRRREQRWIRDFLPGGSLTISKSAFPAHLSRAEERSRDFRVGKNRPSEIEIR